MSKKILIVDDEKEIVELIELYLSQRKFYILKAYDGEQALQILQNDNVDLLIVDIMMPKINGYNLVKEIRKEKTLPIIMISAKNEGYDKILGLDLGADDYIIKPFDPLELVARVQAQLRRQHHFNVPSKQQTAIQQGDLLLNIESCLLKKNGQDISLTSTEYKLLELFMTNPNRVFTKRQLFEKIWEDAYFGDDNTIMVHISKLRDKIEDNNKNPKYLQTIRGLGYIFKVQV
ncbi:response regulator transcription factor [Bacillus sp. 179-I 2A5 NHS]|uniref:response regulator transcription factor n=1 Tax=Bacillus TaxID=1386 RepID=UPI000BFA1289|nr:response regulator transcription factor [Bacillus cereus]PER29684.1 DNA-binding response regulator [Bacillus cereus]